MTDANANRISVLVIDDDDAIREIFKARLEYAGYEVAVTGLGQEGLARFKERRQDVVVTDIRLPDLKGVEVLQAIKAIDEEAIVLLMTGYATIDDSITALRLGAEDYFPKPLHFEHLILVIGRALERRRMRRELEALSRSAGRRTSLEELIGGGSRMNDIYRRIETLSQNMATVLIQGETGSGKELAARAIHTLGPRAKRPFIAVNCGGLPESLLESELFGYTRGAFTGADAARQGLFQAANGGTIFLDEIEAASPHTQVALLRVLDRKEILPLGATRPEPLNVRIQAASNKDLEAMVGAGTFREDLFYRLIEATLRMPPLAERTEDIPLLIETFFARLAAEDKTEPRRLSPSALSILLQRSWPGNVRELKNLISRLAREVHRPLIRPADLPPDARQKAGQFSSIRTIAEREREQVCEALERCAGKKAEAARLLGISRTTLYSMMKKHQIEE